MLAILTLIFIIIAFTIPWLIVRHIGQGKIHDVASEIVTIASDQRSLVDEIVNWQENNLEDLWDQKNPYPYIELFGVKYYRVSKYPHVYMRRYDSWWIIFFRYGKCEEYARLFAELVNTAKFGNMRARVVYNLGIDHVWNEVWVDEGWMHVDSIKDDPATKEQGIIDDPSYYERSENGMGENLWFVYAVDEEGNIYDVTENYVETTRLSKLTIRVERGGKPVSGAKVTIKKGNDTSAPFRTDGNGVCTFNLTENEDYRIAAESGWIGDYRRAEVITHIEKDDEIYLHLDSSKFLPPEEAASLFLIIVTLCLFLLIWKFLPAGYLILLISIGSVFVFYGLNGWKPLPIIIGSAILGFGLKRFINDVKRPKNYYLTAAGILMIIAAFVCSFVGLISCPANLFWIVAALVGFVSAYVALWRGQFQRAFVGALTTAAIGIALLFPVRGFGFMPALSVSTLCLFSATLILYGRRLNSK